MDRSFGLSRGVTAAGQLQKSYPPAAGNQPLPAGQPAVVTPDRLGIVDPGKGKPLELIVIGDTGGVKTPGPQNAVASAIEAENPPAFIDHVGDVVYFNGDASEYVPQFYEPYAGVGLPIVAIPGNHDGDTTDDASRLPLDTFMANFCTPGPAVPPGDPQMEYGRHTQTLPWCDWGLELAQLTLLSLYSNVHAGGHIEASQTQWLTAQLAAARADVPLIVQLHHPPYSVDAHHGGSKTMGDLLDKAFMAAGRWPDVVLSGHVHDYQRFSRTVTPTENASDERTVTYIVIGNSGYHNLHKLAKDATAGMDLGAGVTFEYGDASEYGYLRLTVDAGKISGSYTGVTPGVMPDGSDRTITAGKDTF